MNAAAIINNLIQEKRLTEYRSIQEATRLAKLQQDAKLHEATQQQQLHENSAEKLAELREIERLKFESLERTLNLNGIQEDAELEMFID